MCLHVYYACFDQPLPPATFDSILATMPHSIKDRVGTYRRWQDAHSCLLGRYLLSQALAALGGLHSLDDIRFTTSGKPYLEGGPEFSISHSGTMVAIAISTHGPVGIDLEQIQHIPIAIFRDQFTADEWVNIISSSSPLATFYQYWTMKEAVLKMWRTSFPKSLSLINLGSEMGGRSGSGKYHLTQIDAWANYICHIASSVPIHYRLANWTDGPPSAQTPC